MVFILLGHCGQGVSFLTSSHRFVVMDIQNLHKKSLKHQKLDLLPPLLRWINATPVSQPWPRDTVKPPLPQAAGERDKDPRLSCSFQCLSSLQSLHSHIGTGLNHSKRESYSIVTIRGFSCFFRVTNVAGLGEV